MGKITFPPQFKWGTATASYQIEGGWAEGGRGWSIWDAYSHTPGRTLNGNTGDVACDHYHRYVEDVRLLKDLGFKHYRLSISWSRILPSGRGEVNKEGVAFYNALLNELKSSGIEPVVTLYHWDLPLALATEEDGWLGPGIVDAFASYAEACFTAFGDKVKWWLTLNEPWCCAVLGHNVDASHAPGRRINPGVEVYLAAHHMILAHAKAVQVYRTRFQTAQQGRIGITLNCDWYEPKPGGSGEDNERASRQMLDWMLGWFADPIYFGTYPATMRQALGPRLPEFTAADKALVRNSADFLGLNHYSTQLCTFAPQQRPGSQVTAGAGGYFVDTGVMCSADPSWPRTDMGWSIVPWGIRKILQHIWSRYHPPGGIIVTENGCAVHEPDAATAVQDQPRIEYLKTYIAEVGRAIEQGVDCRGYFVWSLLDNFEWAFGYDKRFGITRVDFNTQQRTPKASAHWFAELMRNNVLETDTS